MTEQSTDIRIPEAFAYFRLRDDPASLALKKKFERLAGTPLDISEELATSFGRAMNIGDPLADSYIDAAFASPKGRGRARKDVEQALSSGIESVVDPSPELVALFDQIDTDPEWLDWDKVEHGAEVFRRYGKEMFPYLGIMSFPGFTLETITKPLALTGAYTGGSAFGRFLETCRFWTDSSEPGGLRPGGVGRRSSVLVRILHGMIRHTVLPHPEWDRAKLGVPISQFGLFGTMMLSTFVPGTQLRLLGYLTSAADVEAAMHHWRYIGYLCGAESPWYPETLAEGFKAALLTFLVEEPRPGKDSADLCQSFMNTYRPAADAHGLGRVYGNLRYSARLGHARFYLGKENFEAAALPDAGLWRFAPLAHVLPNLARETARKTIPAAAKRIDASRRHDRQEFVNQNLEGGEAKFTPVDRLTR